MTREKKLSEHIVTWCILLMVSASLIVFGTVKYKESSFYLKEAKNYVPDVTITDEEGLLQNGDMLKDALQNYSEKAGISLKLIVCCRIDAGGKMSFSDRDSVNYFSALFGDGQKDDEDKE